MASRRTTSGIIHFLFWPKTPRAPAGSGTLLLRAGFKFGHGFVGLAHLRRVRGDYG